MLNAEADVDRRNTVTAAGRTFTGRNLVLGTRARAPDDPDIPGLDLRGVYDFVSLVEELDYEPTRCVIIGGSKVAIEYGSFFQATGCDTTIVSRSPLMRTEAACTTSTRTCAATSSTACASAAWTILEEAVPIEVSVNGG